MTDQKKKFAFKRHCDVGRATGHKRFNAHPPSEALPAPRTAQLPVLSRPGRAAQIRLATNSSPRPTPTHRRPPQRSSLQTTSAGPLLLFLLPACVRVTQLSDDTHTLDDSAPLTETACVPDATTGYATPDGRWALAALYGARRLADVPDTALSLGPEWFLASAWATSAFGCGDFGAPWTPSEATEDEGCLRIQEGTHWVELCRMFPGLFPCEAREARISGDQVLGGVVALTWHAHLAHALQQRHGVDPDAWLQAAGDPRAVELWAALLHAEGAWSWQVEPVLADCADDVAACVEGDARRHLDGVAEKLDRLEDAGCYDAPLTEAELGTFLDELAQVFPDEDWESARAAALAQVDGRGFTEAGPAVLDTLDAALQARLVCPERELWDYYQLSCP